MPEYEVKIRGPVFGFHDAGEPCPEVMREQDGRYVACGHESHKVDEVGDRILEQDRKQRLLEHVIPEVEQRFQEELEAIEARRDSGNGRSKRDPRECMCGCGGTTKGGRFLPGHDAKLKSQLLHTIRDIEARAPERARAIAQMDELGWGKFVASRERETAEEREAAEV